MKRSCIYGNTSSCKLTTEWSLVYETHGINSFEKQHKFWNITKALFAPDLNWSFYQRPIVWAYTPPSHPQPVCCENVTAFLIALAWKSYRVTFTKTLTKNFTVHFNSLLLSHLSINYSIHQNLLGHLGRAIHCTYLFTLNSSYLIYHNIKI